MLTSLKMREIKTPLFRSSYLGDTFAEQERFYEKIRNNQQVWSDVELSVEVATFGYVINPVWDAAYDQVYMRGYGQIKSQIYWPIQHVLEDQWWGF